MFKQFGLPIDSIKVPGGAGRSALTFRFKMDPDGDKDIPNDCSCNDMPRESLMGKSSDDGCTHHYVSRVNWIIPDKKTDEGGLNMLQLVPTPNGRGASGTTVANFDDPYSLRNATWLGPISHHPYRMWLEFKCQAMAIGVPEDVVNTRTVFQQYLCHWVGVEAVKPGKPSWNFEPQRHALGTWGFIKRGVTGDGACN